MRNLLLILTLNLSFHTVFGNIPDILEDRLRLASSDTAKVMVYNQFARDLMEGGTSDYYQIQRFLMQGGISQNFHYALQYAKQGLELAEQARWDKGRAELHRTIGIAYFNLQDFDKTIEHYGLAFEICEKLQDKNGMALNLYNMGLVYLNQLTRLYHSLTLVQQALLIWEQLGNIAFMTRAYSIIVRIHLLVGEYQLAHELAEKAVIFAQKNGNKREEASLYQRLAEISNRTGDTKAEIEYWQKALQIFEELDDRIQVARITAASVETIYSQDSEMAIDLLKKSAAIYEELSQNDRGLFPLYNILTNE